MPLAPSTGMATLQQYSLKKGYSAKVPLLNQVLTGRLSYTIKTIFLILCNNFWHYREKSKQKSSFSYNPIMSLANLQEKQPVSVERGSLIV